MAAGVLPALVTSRNVRCKGTVERGFTRGGTDACAEALFRNRRYLSDSPRKPYAGLHQARYWTLQFVRSYTNTAVAA